MCYTGVVALNRRLDFESLPKKYVSFKVKAIIGEAKSQRSSEATIIVNVQDINDNSPVFSQNVSESHAMNYIPIYKAYSKHLTLKKYSLRL